MMNEMKVSYYELLGMIKEGKQPKQVKWNDKIYEFEGAYGNIVDNYLIDDFANENTELDFFAKDIEIIEEESKRIEKLGKEE